MLRQLSKFVTTGSSTRYYLPSVSKVLGGQENYYSRQFSKTTNKLTIRRNGLVPEIGIRTETRRLSFIKKIICSSPKQKKPTKDDEYCCISKQEYCRLKRLDKQKAEAEKDKNKHDQKSTELKTSQSDCTLREGCKMCKKKMESVSSKAKKLLSMKKNKEVVVKCNKKKKEPKKESKKDSKKTSKKDPCAKRPSGKGKEKESFDPCKNPFNQKESDINAFKEKKVDKNADDKKAKTDNSSNQKKEEQKTSQQDENVSKEDKCAKKKEIKAASPCKNETAVSKTGDSKEVKDVEKKNSTKEEKNDCQPEEKLDKLVKPAESKTCDKPAESNKAKEACDKCSEELCLEEKPSNVIMPKKENDGCKQLNLALVPVPQSQLKKDACGKKKSSLVGIIQKGKEWAASKSSNKDQNKNLKLMKQVEKEEISLNKEKRALLQKKKRMSEERQLVEVEKSLCDEETSQFEKEKKIFTSEKKMLSDLKRCIEQCEAEEKKNKSGKS